MTDYNELVNALRWCAKPIPCSKTECPRKNTDEDCACHVLQDSAAAIEELQAEVKRLELDNEDYEYTLRERYNETITLEQAIDRLHELGWLQEHDRILTEPKRGEWIRKDAELYYWHECSKCGERPLYDRYANKVLSAYCPNCGADMRTMEVQDG